MLWVEPPEGSLWKEAVHNLCVRGGPSPSARAVRILRLQGLYTVSQLVDAGYTGTLLHYPGWLQDEAQRMFQALRPALEREGAEQRIAWNERRARMMRLDWSATVVARSLSQQEAACLAALDVRVLNCQWSVKHLAWHLDARDALDAAILNRTRLLAVKHCGPARVEMLRAAIERALRGDRWPDDSTAPPAYMSPAHTVAGRSLLPLEIVVLAEQPVSVLPLSTRAARVVSTEKLELETCLDLAAMLDWHLWSIPGCGRGTVRECHRLIADRLARVCTDEPGRPEAGISITEATVTKEM